MITDSQSDDRLTLTVQEAGRMLGISRATAYQLANEGKLPAIRLGRRLLISKAGLERMVNQAGDKTQQADTRKIITPLD